MSTIVRIDQNARRSRASVFGDLVFLAGQVADDKSGDIASQTREALAKVDDMLARAGTDKSRALSVQIWLKSMEDFAAMNAVYDAWVVPGDTPTRCCGKVELADPAYRVEIVVIAAR
jgi:enamine deaminase RidA (YjgF/YER057c/UK114 family)